MILAAAASSGIDWGSVISYIPTLIPGAGVAGFWVVSYLKGWQVPRASHQETCDERDRALADRDEWKQLYLEEREAHLHTRDAMIAANQRGDAAMESGRVVASVMEAFRAQAESAHEARVAAPPRRRRDSGSGS